jgi:hypothetical protein
MEYALSVTICWGAGFVVGSPILSPMMNGPAGMATISRARGIVLYERGGPLVAEKSTNQRASEFVKARLAKLCQEFESAGFVEY